MAALAAFLLLVARAAPAQDEPPGVPASNAHDDSCLASIPDSALTRVPVYESLTMIDSGYNTAPPSVENLVQAIADRVQGMLGAHSPVLPHGEPRVTWRDVRAPGLLVVWHKDGAVGWTIDGALPSSDTGKVRGARLLAAALDSARAAGDVVMIWPSGNTADSIRFHLGFERPWIDIAGTIHPARAAEALPLFSVAVPRERPLAYRHWMRKPAWPTSLGYEVEGTLIAEFVVDTTGRVDMSTFRSVWPSDKPKPTGVIADYYDAFLKNVRTVVGDAKFTPTRYGSCVVRQIVRQPFTFKVN